MEESIREVRGVNESLQLQLDESTARDAHESLRLQLDESTARGGSESLRLKLDESTARGVAEARESELVMKLHGAEDEIRKLQSTVDELQHRRQVLLSFH